MPIPKMRLTLTTLEREQKIYSGKRCGGVVGGVSGGGRDECVGCVASYPGLLSGGIDTRLVSM